MLVNDNIVLILIIDKSNSFKKKILKFGSFALNIECLARVVTRRADTPQVLTRIKF